MGKFENETPRAGAVFRLSEVGRGAAFGDRQHWLGLRLVGADGRGDMLGARVAIIRSEGPTLWRRARADGSYASANDPRVVAGLGRSPAVRAIQVIWPSGRMEEWSGVPVDRYTTLKEGSGRELSPP